MTAGRETSATIERDAAAWVARIDRARLGDDEQARFDAWLAGDRRRLGAFARLQAVLAHCDRASALTTPSAPAPRRRSIGWAAAAMTALAASVAGLFLVPSTTTIEKRLETARGEIRLVPLPDGSRVTLDTGSAVVSRFEPDERLIALDRGTALFDVAKDHERPFVVRAGDTDVVAVGTSFSVARLDGGGARVVVREGVVAMRHPALARPLRVTANMIAIVPGGATAPSVGAATPAEVDRRLAWQSGMLVFDGQPLAAAAAEFRRYGDPRIVIDDPLIARRTIAGRFAANDPRGFARAAALSLGITARDDGAGIHLTR